VIVATIPVCGFAAGSIPDYLTDVSLPACASKKVHREVIHALRPPLHGTYASGHSDRRRRYGHRAGLPDAGCCRHRLGHRDDAVVRRSPGEVNDVSMFVVDRGDGPGQAVRELGSSPAVAGPGCQQVDKHMAWYGALPTAMHVNLGDLNDGLLSNDLGGTVHGGSGDDLTRMGQSSGGALFGDSGNDTLSPSEAVGHWTAGRATT
jgi:hypothetical protein